ncbi:MAG TPA: hypothetical protein VFV38_19405 [Ktedonobacteraceae bacterium]|nr:hypothetical protein [Ktedonobacteraceae bacterium]
MSRAEELKQLLEAKTVTGVLIGLAVFRWWRQGIFLIFIYLLVTTKSQERQRRKMLAAQQM